MLIHKRSMAVLDAIWVGEHRTNSAGVSYPIYRIATLSDVDDPDEWWEVPRNSPIGKLARRFYPWITPEVDQTGNLVGLIIQREVGEDEAAIRDEMKKEAENRGYRRTFRVRPKNMMTFLRKDTKS